MCYPIIMSNQLKGDKMITTKIEAWITYSDAFGNDHTTVGSFDSLSDMAAQIDSHLGADRVIRIEFVK